MSHYDEWYPHWLEINRPREAYYAARAPLVAEIERIGNENKRLVSSLTTLNHQLTTEQKMSFRTERDSLQAKLDALAQPAQADQVVDANKMMATAEESSVAQAAQEPLHVRFGQVMNGKMKAPMAQPAQQEPVAYRGCSNCKWSKWPYGQCDGCSKSSGEETDDDGNWEAEDAAHGIGSKT